MHKKISSKNIHQTIHVEVDANQKILDVHDSIDNLERKVHEQFGIDLTIHMDPIVIDNEVINDLRQRVKGGHQGDSSKAFNA